jgi:hypothetical protein
MTLRLHDSLLSGNGYKVRLLPRQPEAERITLGPSKQIAEMLTS